MTARHKYAPVSASAVTGNGNGAEKGIDRSGVLAWEDWFQHAGPQQRALALGLAQQQGLVYAHQLPAVTNGKAPTHAADSSSAKVLARLLAGKIDCWPALAPLTLTYFDSELDGLQQQAVLRALASPDVFLLPGLPGTGKSRVVAEIVLQAASRGWRTLLLGGRPGSVDVVLERLVGKTEVLALRMLEATEKPESLPAWLRGFTLDEQKKAFVDRAQLGARGNIERVEAACRRHAEQQPRWAELTACAERCQHLQEQYRQLQEQIPQVPAAVERDAEADSALAAHLAARRQSHDAAGVTLSAAAQVQRNTLEQYARESAEIAARIARLEPAYLAKKQGRFWTPGYWLSLFNGQIIAEMASLQAQQAQTQQRQQAVVQELEQLDRQAEQRRTQFQQERTALLAAETAARQQALQTEMQNLALEQAKLDAEWTARCACLDVATMPRTAEAVALAHQAWLTQKALGEEECQFAHQWVKFIDEASPQWAARLSNFANVLAGTVGRWHADAKFRESAATPFDLVILEDADALAEADLVKLAGLGARCVLVGTILIGSTLPEPAARSSPAKSAPATGGWQRLWQAMGGGAGCWPHSWQREEARLVCQLMPLAAADHTHLYCESLADAADIELRILHRPDTRPCLAQVSFGAQYPFADAFAFMVHEVQEFPLQPLGRTGWWCEDERRVCRRFDPAHDRTYFWIDAEPGVRLGTTADRCGDATRIGAIEFDRSAGWDRAPAEAWLKRHQPADDHERTAFLQVPYRFQPELARIVATVLQSGDWLETHTPAAPGGTGCHGLEFVAVPPLERRDGAGLELDLSVPRSADKLPAGLRQGLPTRGFVNYPEAQAVLGRLEAWSQKEASAACRVAVLALYEGQALLLRRLVEQSEILRSRRHLLEVALPSKIHQREYDVVFLSLTRSPTQRACAFGEDVRELPIALTRARTRLIVFGDTGALGKRLSHQGPLERHDTPTAHHEHTTLSHFMTCLHSHAASHGKA